MKCAPAVRKDGTCACGCGKMRLLTTKAHQLPNLDIMLKHDPFYSAACARKYYGVVLSKKENPKMTGNRRKPTDEQRHRMYGRGPSRAAAATA